MIIASFDVGIKNLAYCVLDNSNQKILAWDVVGMPTCSENGIFGELEHVLNSRCAQFVDCDVVLVERQPVIAKRIMSNIQYFIQGFFAGRGIKSIDFDPALKVRAPGKGAKAYRNRKNVSIQACEKFINQNCSEWVKFFKTHKKKDDLADTVTQVIAYNNLKSTKSEEPVKKISGRKPTANQRETKYSKSNIVWLWKNQARVELEANRRFMKDLKSYWRDIDNFLECVF